MRHGMDENETKSEVIIQIAAGSDTTASTIRVTMRELFGISALCRDYSIPWQQLLFFRHDVYG